MRPRRSGRLTALRASRKLITKVLAPYVPTAEDLDGRCQYLVDGTLLPCWSWAAHPELCSGKHKTTGMNVRIACTLAGKLAWISDPIDGSRHDSHCLHESGVLVTLDPADWIADKGYVGNGMVAPVRKPQFRELLDWEKEFNKHVSRIRAVIERVIADFKTWRIMHTDYRRPIETFPATISAVIGLHFWREA
jgi:DDE superfamily endonuclease